MASARKCDRCGVCFDPGTAAGQMMRMVNPRFQDAEEIAKNKVGRYLNNDIPPDGYVDLCPECTGRLISFFIFPNKEECDSAMASAAVKLEKENSALLKKYEDLIEKHERLLKDFRNALKEKKAMEEALDGDYDMLYENILESYTEDMEHADAQSIKDAVLGFLHRAVDQHRNRRRAGGDTDGDEASLYPGKPAERKKRAEEDKLR